MKALRVPPMYKCIGLVDADMLDNGTRHPNLVLMKLAGFFHDNHLLFELILDPNADITRYSKIYMSRVFTFTKLPDLYLKAKQTDKDEKFKLGGTGFYADIKSVKEYSKERENDMTRLEHDEFLNSFPNHSGGQSFGISMPRQMPYYHLYDAYVGQQIQKGYKKEKYKDYQNYSIGFLTRGCFRRCPFCVNKLERKAMPYSKLTDFLDNEIDEKTGKLKRPYIYLWDDNFLASPYWEKLLDELIATKRPFQFRQGLDERLLAQHKRGEDMARKLASSNYHGDFIFAFDNWFDRKIIVKALKIWKYYCPKKETKFYLFCGFHQSESGLKQFQQDIAEIFMRICVLMRYGCLPYLMRHEDYKKAPVPNLYVQIARWCNQPGFYRNLSFWQFCYKNQTYWEEHTLGIAHSRLKTYEEFVDDLNNGYYDDKKICMPLKSVHNFLQMYSVHKELFLSFFNLSFKQMTDSSLWERKDVCK